MIVGISGYMGSGKDTVARIIQYLDSQKKGYKGTYQEWCMTSDRGLYPTSWEVKKWAGKLKQIASLLTGIPVENFEDQEFKKTEMGAMWGMSVREFLQKLGTEALRDGLHKNVWINALMSEYKIDFNRGREKKEYDKRSKAHPTDVDLYPKWIISDTRYPNEAEVIADNGGIIIRVNRNLPVDPASRHPTETSLDNWDFDVVIDNNGSIEDLISTVKWVKDSYHL